MKRIIIFNLDRAGFVETVETLTLKTPIMEKSLLERKRAVINAIGKVRKNSLITWEVNGLPEGFLST